MGRSSSAARQQKRDADTKLAQGRLSVLELAEAVLGLGLTHSRKAYPRSPAPKHSVIHAMGDTAEVFGH
jgi:hypothetical protein